MYALTVVGEWEINKDNRANMVWVCEQKKVNRRKRIIVIQTRGRREKKEKMLDSKGHKARERQ